MSWHETPSLFCSWSQGEEFRQGTVGMALSALDVRVSGKETYQLGLTLTLGAGLLWKWRHCHICSWRWVCWRSFRKPPCEAWASSQQAGLQSSFLVVEGSDRRLTWVAHSLFRLTVDITQCYFQDICQWKVSPHHPVSTIVKGKGQDPQEIREVLRFILVFISLKILNSSTWKGAQHR